MTRRDSLGGEHAQREVEPVVARRFDVAERRRPLGRRARRRGPAAASVIGQLTGGAPPASLRVAMNASSSSMRAGSIGGGRNSATMRVQTSCARWVASRAPRSVQVPKFDQSATIGS